MKKVEIILILLLFIPLSYYLGYNSNKDNTIIREQKAQIQELKEVIIHQQKIYYAIMKYNKKLTNRELAQIR